VASPAAPRAGKIRAKNAGRRLASSLQGASASVSLAIAKKQKPRSMLAGAFSIALSKALGLSA
jgi:hypothetical protein